MWLKKKFNYVHTINKYQKSKGTNSDTDILKNKYDKIKNLANIVIIIRWNDKLKLIFRNSKISIYFFKDFLYTI